ncbi:MAG: hypothetical protein H0X03_07870 [Nitrosopumilus sp.]|nr:hypothetical protein [Nitrosopumilus sp.]
MLLGPGLTNIGSVCAEEYDDWEDCRDDHSKNWCADYFEHHGNNNNAASQEISQEQSSEHNSQCVSDGSTFASYNNFSFQNQVSTSNYALAQQ